MKAFVAFLVIVIVIGSEVVLAKRRRRTGVVPSYGHPIKDSLLLLASGILVAVAVGTAIEWTRTQPRHPVFAAYAMRITVLVLAATLTWLSNSFLGRGKREP
jgi:hypothetical protein